MDIRDRSSLAALMDDMLCKSSLNLKGRGSRIVVENKKGSWQFFNASEPK